MPVDFRSHKLVGIGHSMGAISTVLSSTYPDPPRFRALILVDPMLMSKANDAQTGKKLSQLAVARRDVWPSREDAYNAMVERKAYKVWDPRVLRAFCVSSFVSRASPPAVSSF